VVVGKDTGGNGYAMEEGAGKAPLSGIRVLELSNFYAGPFCGCLLADFGADVIKAEQPGLGDSWRGTGVGPETSMPFMQDNRNKRSITLNLSQPKGQALARRLASMSDVVIENFRGGGLEAWGLGYADLAATNPGLVMVRISGFGQSGLYKDRAAFGTVLEAMSGYVRANGDQDGRPRILIPSGVGDLLTGTFAAYGVMLALRQRELSGKGQEIDAAICDALFRWIHTLPADYALKNEDPPGQGNALWAKAPTQGFFQCADGTWLFIRSNRTDAGVAKLYNAMDRPELWADPRYGTDAGRRAHAPELRVIIEEWVASIPREAVMNRLDDAGVPCGPVYSMADVFADPHFQARCVFPEVFREGVGMVPTPAPAPRLVSTPGKVTHLGPELGEHNDEVYRGLLKLSDEEFTELRNEKVI
jgi:crotonobetainyl-CoA:carnitine CoA-transferase CaiB-like acyl-CoA transferase